MPQSYPVQASFAGGEFSPSLYARVDIAKYLTGAKTLRNFTVLPHGGARNRPGTAMVAAAGNSALPIRLIPFVASTTQAYVVEFGNYYARFYTQDAAVQYANFINWTPGYLYNSFIYVQYQGNFYVAVSAFVGAASFATDLAAGRFVLLGQTTANQWQPGFTSYSIGNLINYQGTTYVSVTGGQTSGATFIGDLNKGWWVNATYPVANPWATAESYIVGNYVVNSGIQYYCLVANTSSSSFSNDLAAGYWTPQTAYQIVTPYPSSALFQIKYAQSADVLFMAHPIFAPQQLTFNGASSWSVTPYSFINGPFQVQNLNTASTITPSAVSNAGGTAYTVTSVVSSSGTLVFTISGSNTIAVGQTFTPSGFTGGAAVLNGIVLTVLLINFGGNPAQIFVGTNQGLGNGTYSGGTITMTGPITLTATLPIFQAGHVGALFQLVDTLVAQTITDAGFTSNTHASTAIQCGANWSIITFGTWTGKILIQISTDNGSTWKTVQTLQSSGTNNYQTSGSTGVSQCLLRCTGDGVTTWSGTLTIDLTATSFDWIGVVQITSVTNATVALGTVLSNTGTGTGLGNTSAKYQWSEGSWSTYRGWPSCVTFYQDRLAWASTPNSEPQTVWFSQTASYSNFGVSEPVQDTDSISAVLPGRQLNAVHNLIVMPQFLVALTSDSEWAINPASGSGAFTPSTINIALQGHRGSSAVFPAVVGIELILIQQMGTVVRNLIYQLAVNGFFGDNISIVSQHLFTGYTINEMAYQQEPDSIIWAVRSDGQLLSCTYMRDQEMNAWTHHDTQGTFESVCTIPNSTLGLNEVWVVANRTVNGQTVRFIERLMPRDQGTVPAQQFFVDCGISTTFQTPQTVIGGLSYLNGMAVSVLADGNVVACPNDPALPTMIVTNGQITLPVAATVVTVGLPYTCDLETLRIESQNQQGTLQGRRVSISGVTVRFWNSRSGFQMSCSQSRAPADNATSAGFDEIIQREVTDNYNSPIALKTQDYLIEPANGGFDFGAHLFFRQVHPLPMTVLGIMPTITAGEK